MTKPQARLYNELRQKQIFMNSILQLRKETYHPQHRRMSKKHLTHISYLNTIQKTQLLNTFQDLVNDELIEMTSENILYSIYQKMTSIFEKNCRERRRTLIQEKFLQQSTNQKFNTPSCDVARKRFSKPQNFENMQQSLSLLA